MNSTRYAIENLLFSLNSTTEDGEEYSFNKALHAPNGINKHSKRYFITDFDLNI
jgi:hypothetical protein